MLKKLRLPSHGTVVAYLALFVALGGTAYAANEWTGANIVDESLTSLDILGKGGTATVAAVNGTIITHDIAGQQENPANGTPFIDGTITTWDVRNGTLTNADIAPNTIAGGRILDDTIAAADLGTGSVGTDELQDGAVTSAKVLDDSAVGGGLNPEDLGPNSVGSSEIQTDAVNATEVANDSIDSGEIVDFGLTNQDIGVLFAQLNADGTVANSSGGVTAIHIGTGTYEVDFGHNISSCAFVMTQGEAGVGGAGGGITGVTDRSGNAEAVFATMRNDANALVDRAFQLVVVC